MKKFWISFFIILVAAGTALYIGWLELHIPTGTYGVMVSKTGGMYPYTIQGGNFTWRWERLFPTNTELRSFSVTPVSGTVAVKGTLPSGDIYSSMLEGSPDFSYTFSVSVRVRINADSLPEFVSRTNARTQTDIEQYLSDHINSVAQAAVAYITDRATTETDAARNPYVLDTDKIREELKKQHLFSDIEITSLSVDSVKIPDTALYQTAKEAYLSYQNQVRSALADAAQVQAGQAADDYLQIERFAKWGKILQEYPVLIDFLAISREDAAHSIAILEQLKNRK